METIRLNHHYTKVKGIILMILVVIGGALGNMLIVADEYFDLLKALICTVIFIILIFVYVHLEHIDPEIEELKGLATLIKEKVDDEAAANTEKPPGCLMPPSEQ